MRTKALVQTHTKRGIKTPPNAPESRQAGLHKPQEYSEFVTFIALPRALRGQILEVDSQEEFAIKYGINRNTLVAWKKRIGFWDEVHAVRKDFFKERSGDVLLALETACLREGKGADVRVLLTYTGEYADKVEQEHRITPELQQALEKIGRLMP